MTFMNCSLPLSMPELCICSKYKTFHEVLPNLYDPVHFSYDQLLDGLSFLGNDYEKFVEIFTVQTNHVFGLDTSKPTLTVLTFTLKLTGKMISAERGQARKIKKSP